MSALPSPWLAALRALTVGGSLLPLGGWAMWLIAHPTGAVRACLWRSQRRWTAVSAVVALAAGVGWLGEIVVRLAGSSGIMAMTPTQWSAVLRETTFGHEWLMRSLALGLLVVLASIRRPPATTGSWLGLGAGAVAAVSVSLTSHAAASGHGWRLAADMAHITAAGLWLGALPLLARMLGRGVFEPTAADRVTRAFSRMGVACVAVLVFSGGVNASALGLSALWWRSDYGRLVLIKIVLFAGMLSLALYNRRRLTPRLAGAEAESAARALRRSIMAELALGVLIVAVVGVLGATMPPHAPG